MDLLRSFKDNWERKNFGHSDKPVLLAVSGGIDSMVMATLFQKLELSFAVAHCNFKLRGADADADEQFVKNWAEQNKVPFFCTTFQTEAIAADWKKGIQETARMLRYEWLDEIRKNNRFGFVATAHHANDNAETLLINLFRGCGISGLHGIPEINEHTIRPLLFATRAEIAAFAQAQNILYREDVSNASDKYLRNSVRHKLLPVAEELFPGCVEHINQSIHRFAEAEELYNRAVSSEIKKLVEQRGSDLYISINKLKQRSPLDTICYELFRMYGFSAPQIPQLIHLMYSESGHYIASSTHRVIKDRGFLIITSVNASETDLITIEAVPCKVKTGGAEFHFSMVSNTKKIPEDPNTAFIDANELSFPLYLRKWRAGDYFYPLGMGMKKKKLSRFFIDQKLPVHKKESTWVLESKKRIAWVAGLRLDERFKIGGNTKNVLQIKLMPSS